MPDADKFNAFPPDAQKALLMAFRTEQLQRHNWLQTQQNNDHALNMRAQSNDFRLRIAGLVCATVRDRLAFTFLLIGAWLIPRRRSGGGGVSARDGGRWAGRYGGLRPQSCKKRAVGATRRFSARCTTSEPALQRWLRRDKSAESGSRFHPSGFAETCPTWNSASLVEGGTCVATEGFSDGTSSTPGRTIHFSHLSAFRSGYFKMYRGDSASGTTQPRTSSAKIFLCTVNTTHFI